jgi:putative FmdB family regulatory protein
VPTYDYQCRACGTVTEVIHSMLAEGPTTCERCGGELRRVIFPTGIIFKGSGFYRNDSRAAATASTGDTGTASDGSSGPGKGAATDAKPAPATKDASSAPADGSGGRTAAPASES